MNAAPPSTHIDTVAFDPVTLEILWSRLTSIADEAAAGLVRTAFSTIVRESNDYATVLMDRDGNSIAENTGGIASFSCILPRTTKEFLRLFPIETWRPGDCIITNDPWLATGHLPDFTFVSPVFHKDRLVGFAGSIAHSPDIGGALWSADCREVFEEGVRVPPMHFFREGKLNQDLVTLLMSNVRVPRQVMGDYMAQYSANQVSARRLDEFLTDSALPDLQGIATAIHEKADGAMRRAIEAMPEGVYSASLDYDGFDDEITTIACSISIKNGQIAIDYNGTSPQIARGINCVMNYTHAYSCYPIKCALDPLTPRNEGTYRAITVTAPEGTILNPQYPAPVGARQLTGHLLAGVIYKALAEVIPDRVIAECGGAPSMRALFSGQDHEGNRFSQVLFATGGMGAAPHRDGLSTTSFPTNLGAGSIESFESVSPLIVWRKELMQDSGGPGKFRGGLGQIAEIEVRTEQPAGLSLLSDRRDHPAIGLLGGKPGGPAIIRLSDGREPHQKSRTTIAPGERLTMIYPGGGGFGPSSERDPEAVARDIRDGYISADAARIHYGRND